MSEPDVFALVLQEAERGITIEVGEEDLRRLHDEMRAVIDAAEKAMGTISELAGPEPGPLPQHLRTMMIMGAGYFRHTSATLERLFRARNSARSQER